jgi:SAM-dependent methyltransferase
LIEDAELASYFGVEPEILEYLPELLQDLWELGSDPELVVEWLGEQGIGGSGHRVLDLGCGKGAVALAVAEGLGCSVDGIDALPAFVDIARSEARLRGVDQLCRFSVGDLRKTAAEARGYDAVLLVSVGVLGTAEDMTGGCRRCVRSGGLIIIDECYLDQPGVVDFTGYEQLATHGETLRRLTAHGDELVRERAVTADEIRDQNRRYTGWIERRVAELSRRHPEHAAAFDAYLEKEREECELLETKVRCATWMLRRAAD